MPKKRPSPPKIRGIRRERRNAPDLTLRNLHAAKRQLASLTLRVMALERKVFLPAHEQNTPVVIHHHAPEEPVTNSPAEPDPTVGD